MTSALNNPILQNTPNYTDYQYQEAVGRLKQLLTTSSGHLGGSDAGSGYSQHHRPEIRHSRSYDFRSHDVSGYRPDLVRLGSHRETTRFRRETASSYKLEASSNINVFKHDRSSSLRRPESLDLRPETDIFRLESQIFRPEISSFRSESLERYRPHSALGHLPRRSEVSMSSNASLRGVSPVRMPMVSRHSSMADGINTRMEKAEEDEMDGDVTPTCDNFKLRDLRQYVRRQEELNRQLEQENAMLREMEDELRGYVRELVNDNGNLADELRTRASETTTEAKSQLEACRAEIGRLTVQLDQNEEQLTAAHQRQLNRLTAEHDQLITENEQLTIKEEQARHRAEDADKRTTEAKMAAERTQTLHHEAENTANQLRRDLEEQRRLADRHQMEHERHLLAARGEAERAVRGEIGKLHLQIQSHAERIAELEMTGERQQAENSELRAAAQQHMQATTRAHAEADSATTRYRRELEAAHSRLRAAEDELRRSRVARSDFSFRTQFETRPTADFNQNPLDKAGVNSARFNPTTTPIGLDSQYDEDQSLAQMAALFQNSYLTAPEMAELRMVWLDRARRINREDALTMSDHFTEQPAPSLYSKTFASGAHVTSTSEMVTSTITSTSELPAAVTNVETSPALVPHPRTAVANKPTDELNTQDLHSLPEMTPDQHSDSRDVVDAAPGNDEADTTHDTTTEEVSASSEKREASGTVKEPVEKFMETGNDDVDVMGEQETSEEEKPSVVRGQNKDQDVGDEKQQGRAEGDINNIEQKENTMKKSETSEGSTAQQASNVEVPSKDVGRSEEHTVASQESKVDSPTTSIQKTKDTSEIQLDGKAGESDA